MALAPSPTALRVVTLGAGHLGVTFSNHTLGCRIDNAHPPDAIYSAGLREGDVVVAVNGTTVKHHADACDLLGSNLDKPVVINAGSQAAHQISYYPAAIAEQLMRERSPLSGMLGRLVGGGDATPSLPDAPGDEVAPPAAQQGSLWIMVAAVAVGWWLLPKVSSGQPGGPSVFPGGDW